MKNLILNLKFSLKYSQAGNVQLICHQGKMAAVEFILKQNMLMRAESSNALILLHLSIILFHIQTTHLLLSLLL
jgi:hypothetical protein